MNRRSFIELMAGCGVAAYANPLLARSNGSSYLGLNPIIEAHPDSVFIMRTNIASKTDSTAKLNAGNVLAKEIFTTRDKPGILPSDLIAIKPNLTSTTGTGSTDAGMGIITDRYFTEGLLNGMIERGFAPDKMYMREGNTLGDGYCYKDYVNTGYAGIAEKTGVHLYDLPSGRKTYDVKSVDLQSGTEVIWKKTPDGVVFKRIGYLAPFNQQNSWLLNISKFKAHGMGMTLCAKNLQGCCIVPYVKFCDTLTNIGNYQSTVAADFQSDLKNRIDTLYKKHVNDGIPRWDRPGDNGALDFTSGYGMELWAQRTCDSLSVTKPGLSIIEGIYGRNGNGFVNGPGEGGLAQDFMSNILVFGTNPLLVDIIGIWLAGHEPGNFGFYHIAKERGLLSTLNPFEIPVYEWKNENAVLTPLNQFSRTELVTKYLRKNYNGNSEPEYHLVNEAFNYGVSVRKKQIQSSLKMLGIAAQHRGGSKLMFEYTIPATGYVKIDIMDSMGRIVYAVVDKKQEAGVHFDSWDTSRMCKGTYLLVMQSSFGKHAEKVTLL